jgi:transposase IS116/IS110/IS902 family protein/exopolysaccharide synthesis protein ExoD
LRVAFSTATTLVAEAGDLRRFDHPRKLMAFLGLVPSERSMGETRRQGGITKAGNGRARSALVEAAWTCRHSAGLGVGHQRRQLGLSEKVRDIAWKAQARLGARYRRLAAKGKRVTVVTTAIARELAAFLWDIARHVETVPAGPGFGGAALHPAGVGFIVLLLEASLLAPIPLSNLPPALLIVLIACAYLEEDGALLCGALLAALMRFALLAASGWQILSARRLGPRAAMKTGRLATRG